MGMHFTDELKVVVERETGRIWIYADGRNVTDEIEFIRIDRDASGQLFEVIKTRSATPSRAGN